MILVGLTGGIGAGKSTVSSMLAERGAAIVDADQIARDIQAPGSPVLDAMAERFGAHIINDDGSLDRAAVAKIVFSDKQALEDLNGIVHPAMQAEIQRQIDEHRDTDRLVVLDFPLLGENPRAGLAATIVVDIPYHLAVERVVEFRGMDEEDARNRVNSQISREKRLESATHVVDNSGDLVDLHAQVDRLWPQLVELPSTVEAEGTSDRRSADGAPDDTDTWVFGYGSLVSPTSLARTIGRTAVLGEDFLEAELDGFGRRWNYGAGSIAGTWKLPDGEQCDDGVIVALGVIASADESTIGVVARVEPHELAALDERERDYDRVDVTNKITIAGGPVGRVVTYVPRPSAIARYENARDNGTAGIRRTYWDLVDEAFAVLGDDRVETYRATTPEPDVPIVDLLDTRVL